MILGRDSSSTVQYDADRDDLVGRQHAKISRDPSDPNGFMVEDMESRNGTFVNGQKLSAPQKLYPGDKVQLGTGGPEFTFDVEPRPEGATKATRIASTIDDKTAPETRVSTAAAGSIATAPTGKVTVGKATVERMISSTVTETKKQEGKKYATVGAIAAIAILLLGGIAIGGVYFYQSRQQAALQSELANKSQQLESQASEMKTKMDQGGISAAEISDKYSKAVVYIQASWQLVNKESKSQIYHQFIPNSKEALSQITKQNYGKGPLVPNGGDAIPLYIQTENGSEPIMTEQKSSLSTAIGSSGYTCSGFLVTTDGFMLTNRHCAAPWRATYSFPNNYPPGLLLDADGKIVSAGIKAPGNWIPENTKSVQSQYKGQFDGDLKLSVMLPGTDNPIEAQTVQVSPRHDVAMMKISVPGNLPKVELYDAWDTMKKR